MKRWTIKSKDPAVSVLLPGYACQCARCGWAWLSQCDCDVYTGPTGGQIHAEDCVPPPRCPGCKAHNWTRPAAWTPGEGTSREAVRRRNVAARVARESRRTRGTK